VVSFAVLELPTSKWTVAVARHALDGLLDAAGVAAATCGDLALALTEACTNAVRHASAGPLYRVHLHLDDARCLMEIRDRGPGFDPFLVPAPDLDGDGGRGLLIMRAVVDHVRVVALRPHGTRVVMVKSWDHSLAAHLADGRLLDHGQRAEAV
jgi:serine/threonine-protein kinase RsbW